MLVMSLTRTTPHSGSEGNSGICHPKESRNSMADSELASKSTPENEDRQELSTRRDRLVGGSVNAAEYKEVDEALAAARFRTMSEGMRTLGLLFARLPEMRALVAKHRLSVL